jgi:hypothetical protein
MRSGIPVHNGKNSLRRTIRDRKEDQAMWKLLGWLWKAAAAALLASFLAIWTTGYIVNSYVEALLEEYEIPLEKPPFALSGLWGRLWGVDARPQDGRSALAADREPIGGFEDARKYSGGSGGSSGRENGRTGGSGGAERSGGDQTATEPAGGDRAAAESAGGENGGHAPMGDGGLDGGGTPVYGDGGGTPDDAAGWRPGEEDGGAEGGVTESGFGRGPAAHGAAGGTVVSTEELLEAKSRLTEEERNRLFAILVGKVPQEEWQRISEFTEGGLTAEELLQVQQIVATYLDREEYDELMGILNKF